MKRKVIIVSLIILGVSMLSGGVLVIAGFFGGSGDINKGLVGHWKFDGGPEDSTPNSNDGTVTGASLTTDRKGQANKAYNFDGSDDFVQVADDDILDITGSITISVWAKDPPIDKSQTTNSNDQNSNFKNNLEELKIKEIEPDKFAFKSLSGDLIEIGEEKHSPPQPYLKLNKWDGEVSLKIDIPYAKNGVKSLAQSRLKWANHKYDVDFYPREPEEITGIDSQGNEHSFTINEGGGVEFDVILKEKPESNVFEFPIESDGLKFYYQPELTQKEKDEGAFRPENVVGSYAVYHESKQGDYSQMGGKNYKAGKAFHIYRPKITDANGTEVWGILNIDKGILSIEIPQKFLDNAVYPVIVDPTFGYSQIGPSTWSYVDADQMIGSLFQSPSDVGTVESLTFYWDHKFFTGDYKSVLVLHSNLNILTDGIGIAVAGHGTMSSGWVTSSFATPPSLSPNTGYVLMSISDFDMKTIHFDTGDTDQGHLDTSNNFVSPAHPTDAAHDNYKYSIYATYTAAAPNKTIVSKGQDAYALEMSDDGATLYGYINSTEITASISTPLEWHHYALTYDQSTLTLYIDGVSASSTSQAGAIATNATNLKIGEFFSGPIDDVRVYNRALSQAEITSLYDSYDPGITLSSTQKGLVGHWDLDGDAKDRTPYGNDGTVNAAILTADRKSQSNKAYNFTTGGPYIDVGNPDELNDIGDKITLSAWINPLNAGTQVIVGHSYSNVHTDPFYNYLLAVVGGASTINAHVRIGSTFIDGTTNMYDTGATWFHLAVTYDGSDVRLYVNGVEENSTGKTGNIATSNQNVRIGARHTDSMGEWFWGDIDDVRIYNRALSPAEITSLYDSYNPNIAISSTQKGLVGYWDLSGDTKDRTPYGNDGTVSGASLTTDRKGQANSAYSFNGTSDFIDFGTNSVLKPFTALTISSWVYFNSNPPGGWSNWIVDQKNSYALYLVNGKIRFATSRVTFGWHDADAATLLTGGNWYHIVGTWDGTTKTIYLNGVADWGPTVISGDTLITDPNDHFLTGKRYDDGWWLDGVLDDVRIYNRALSPAEITRLYESYF